MNYSDKEQAYLRAKARVEKLSAFYRHLGVYLLVNIAISTIRIVKETKDGIPIEEVLSDFGTYGVWMLWGVGLAIHAFSVFGLPLFLGHDWEEKKIKQFMEEDNSNFN
jgi:hypothetical protein